MFIAKELLYRVVLNAVLWCLVISIYFFATRDEEAPLEDHTINPVKPVVKSIWFSGVRRVFDSEDDSWMSHLPGALLRRYNTLEFKTNNQMRSTTIPIRCNVFIIRYENAHLFTVFKRVVRSQIDQTAPTESLVITEWWMGENEKLESRRHTTLDEFNATKPDVHFLRSAEKIGFELLDKAPWLFDPSIVRIIYSGKFKYQLEYADLVVVSDSFLTPFPRSKLQHFEAAVEKRPQLSDDEQFAFEKDRFVFFPGAISTKRGQLTVANLLDPTLFVKHNLSLVFAGRVVNSSYWEETKQVLTSKSVRFELLEYVEDERALVDLYVGARVVVHYPSVQGENPSVVYEGLFGNTPFLVSDSVQLPLIALNEGRRVVERSNNNSSEIIDFNTKLEFILTHPWRDGPRDFAKRHLSEAQFGRLYQKIECLLSAKQKIVLGMNEFNNNSIALL